jgi:hypothetical protein
MIDQIGGIFHLHIDGANRSSTWNLARVLVRVFSSSLNFIILVFQVSGRQPAFLVDDANAGELPG